ncbi:MAG: 1-phosphofructokinase [Nitrospiraceae bacterium]|nr:1-phosphofructokinase [Nitrospiraceae bacterium]
MIYTITLNPALDRTLWVERIRADDSNRIKKEERYAGGKGIDVSRVLTMLGVGSTALGFVGGFTGAELEGRLLNEGISCDFIRISGETRTNIIMNDMSTGGQSVFGASGPVIEPYELMQMIHKVEGLEHPGMVIISGSIPPGVHPKIYRKIIEIAKNRNAKVILDADGEALVEGTQAFPDIIKPNIHELSRLVGAELKEQDDIIDAARSVQKKGIGLLLVSMGAKGILLIGEKESYHAAHPEVIVKNTIGAGDSAVAGFIYALTESKSLKEALAYAVAAGTATTLMPGTALCCKDDFLRLLPAVHVREL